MILFAERSPVVMLPGFCIFAGVGKDIKNEATPPLVDFSFDFEYWVTKPVQQEYKAVKGQVMTFGTRNRTKSYYDECLETLEAIYSENGKYPVMVNVSNFRVKD